MEMIKRKGSKLRKYMHEDQRNVNIQGKPAVRAGVCSPVERKRRQIIKGNIRLDRMWRREKKFISEQADEEDVNPELQVTTDKHGISQSR